MNIRKWRKYRRSKYRFPTRIVKTGVKGSLHVGAVDAKRDVENELGRALVGKVTRHTRTQWVFCEPLKKPEEDHASTT